MPTIYLTGYAFVFWSEMIPNKFHYLSWAALNIGISLYPMSSILGGKKHEKRKSNPVHLCTMKSWPPFCSEVNHLFSIFPGHVSYPVQLFFKKDSATNMSRDRCLTFWPLMAILNSFIRTGVFSENHFATNFTYFGICSFVNFSGGMTTIVSRKYCKTSAERQIQIS